MKRENVRAVLGCAGLVLVEAVLLALVFAGVVAVLWYVTA